MHENISIELEPMVRLLLEPYEAILDRLLREGRISASERDQSRTISEKSTFPREIS